MRRSFIIVAGVCVVSVGFGAYLLPVRARQTASPAISAPQVIYTPDTKPNRDLHDAVLKGSVAKAKAALSAGADPEAMVHLNGAKEPGVLLFFLASWQSTDKPETKAALIRLFVDKLRNVNLRDERTGQTALMTAVEIGDLSLVKTLVDRGATVDTVTATTNFGQPYGKETAFHQAIGWRGDRGDDPEPIAVYLLEHGANVNHQCADGSTPLIRAAQVQKPNTVRWLLSKGANPSLRDSRDFTALRWAGARGTAKTDEIVALLQDRTEINLWEAATLGKAKRVGELLKAGANPNEPRFTPPTLGNSPGMPPPVGDTPLACAVKSDDPATVKALLTAGANASYTHPRTGKNALHTAATYGSNAVIPLLLTAGADINANAVALGIDDKPDPDQRTQTPLTCAVQAANAETVALLLKNGVVGSKHDQVNVAFAMLIRQGGQAPRRPREQRSDRAKDADEAVDAQNTMLDDLLKAGADMNKTGAVVLAVRAKQPGVVSYLLEKGASPNTHHVSSSDGDETALIAAIGEIANADTERELTESSAMEGSSEDDLNEAHNTAEQCLAILLGAGAKVNEAAHESGTTPVMMAADTGELALIADLVKRGANINATDADGCTALLRVASAGEDVATLRYLLKTGAKINHADKEGYTALMLAIDNGGNAEWEAYRKADAEHIAAEREHMKTFHGSEGNEPTRPNDTGHPKMVEALLKAGADKTVVTKDGQTALSLAQRNGFKSVIALLSAPSPKH